MFLSPLNRCVFPLKNDLGVMDRPARWCDKFSLRATNLNFARFHLVKTITLELVIPTMAESTFPIPSSLQDLEREPYNLLPYPYDFDDDDEEARALSFCRLVKILEVGNRRLATEGMSLFNNENRFPDEDKWMDEERMQALYTLVRYDFLSWHLG